MTQHDQSAAEADGATGRRTAGSDGAHGAWRSFAAGMRETIGLALAALVFGALFGIVAGGKGLSPGEILLMSVSVFAGAAQFATLELWSEPMPYVAIAITGGLVCSRHILMGLSLPGMFRRPPVGRALPALFFLTDVSWVMTMKERDAAHRLAYFVGSGVTAYATWIVGTGAGILTVDLFDPATLAGLSAGGPLFIVVLLVMQVRHRISQPLRPWIVAAAAAAATSLLFDLSVAVLVGVAASAVTSLAARRMRRA